MNLSMLLMYTRDICDTILLLCALIQHPMATLRALQATMKSSDLLCVLLEWRDSSEAACGIPLP